MPSGNGKTIETIRLVVRRRVEEGGMNRGSIGDCYKDESIPYYTVLVNK